jgi:cyclic-di-GMP phosphodiesterase TipF (flagellum assembly factor)
MIAEAVSAGRIDICLEPVIGLGDRKARHFEVSLRLEDADGEVISDGYEDLVRGIGLIAKIDQAKLERIAVVARRLAQRGSKAALFSGLSTESLASEAFLARLDRAMTEEDSLGTRLILNFTQAEIRGFTTVEWAALAHMGEIGLRFTVDAVTDLDLDFAVLKSRGFDFIRLDAKYFLEGLPTGEAIVPAADLCRHFAGLGYGLIVGGIATERELAEIVGFGAVLGQGSLFGGARRVHLDGGQGRAAA